jgi:hypothetical protein
VEACCRRVDDAAQVLESVLERRFARGRESIGTSALFGMERFDQTTLLESRERSVQRAGSESNAGELFLCDQCGER